MLEPRESPNATILVVDDELHIARLCAEALRREGYAVAEAHDGQEALAWLGNHPMPDLILLDTMMPVMDGYTFLEEKQGDVIMANIPVVMLLNRAGDFALERKEIQWAQDLGADAWLFKTASLTPDQVARIVQQRLSGKTGTLPDAYSPPED